MVASSNVNREWSLSWLLRHSEKSSELRDLSGGTDGIQNHSWSLGKLVSRLLTTKTFLDFSLPHEMKQVCSNRVSSTESESNFVLAFNFDLWHLRCFNLADSGFNKNVYNNDFLNLKPATSVTATKDNKDVL